MKKFKHIFLVVILCLGHNLILPCSLLAQGLTTPTYTAIGAKKPKNLKATKIVFVACRADGGLGKYRGPRKDVGTAKFRSVLTAVAAKNLILPAKKALNKITDSYVEGLVTARALVKGKIPYSTSKNLSTLNAEIDACGLNGASPTPTPGPTQTAVAVGMWKDELRSTNGTVNLTVTVDKAQRQMSLKVSVGGFPLGIVDAATIPPETHVVAIPQGQTAAPFTFNSAFVPGNIAGTATINEQAGTFSASGTATHNAGAGEFANSTASFNASGPLTGASVGAITITGTFQAGGNQFSISTNPAP